MAEKRTIAVVGATGAQGGGLVRAIQANPDSGFTARAITRDPSSDKARELAALGAEIVQADLEDPASLRPAFDGAYGAYLVTFFWAHFRPERELAEARAMAEAAKAAGLQHVIWSTLEDSRKWYPLSDDRMPTLMGRYKVPHFDAKGEADQHFRALDVPTTFVLASYYWDNLIHFGAGPTRGADGKLVFTLPMGDRKMPGMAAEDIGKCALGIFRSREQYLGQTVGLAGEQLSGAEMAAALSEALGEAVAHYDPTPAVYRGFGFPGADDLGNMFQFYQDYADYFCMSRDPAVARRLNPELLTFRQWLARWAKHIPIG